MNIRIKNDIKTTTSDDFCTSASIVRAHLEDASMRPDEEEDQDVFEQRVRLLRLAEALIKAEGSKSGHLVEGTRIYSVKDQPIQTYIYAIEIALSDLHQLGGAGIFRSLFDEGV